ncbi:MgtC/SapB family protein [Lysobacter sp. N42]|uniref:MgtC/SapB family protein n=1 Tax=Lysobacter sp. N42 TaxID=2545719 RepID=UPI001050A97C|nr:MgtC/SapB family protein [Lysobacter sp. N42]TCZ88382.1 MgtC/SapB family protein [Lysobacter sp. N42]
MEWLSELEAVGAAAYAMLLGGVIGYERELKNRPAGFRTHMLVAGAAALLMAMSHLALQDPPAVDSSVKLSADPLRLVEAVISGVAFIGAGTIFARKQGQHIAGITTAASLLMVAVIGLITGVGHYLLASAATVLTLLVLTALNLLERRTGMREAGDPGEDDDGEPGGAEPARKRRNPDLH